MNIIELRDRLIEDGIRSVHKHETRLEFIRGGVAGFELCRTLQKPEDYMRILEERHRSEHEMGWKKISVSSEAYWEHRYATIQIEFVFKHLKVGWGMSPLSARALIHYAELVGVKES